MDFENKKNIVLVTHGEYFHADELFATAVIKKVFSDKQIELIRTRDESIIESADIVLDVGRIYDPKKMRFDHHQTGGAGKRENGIPYSAFGLVWKEYGELLCGNKDIALIVENKLVMPCDSNDNGQGVTKPIFDNLEDVNLDSIASLFRPSWQEDFGFDEGFNNALVFFEKILERSIVKAKSVFYAREIVERAYLEATDKRIIVLDKAVPTNEILQKYSEPLFVIGPRKDDNTWGIKAVPLKAGSFENRASLPEEWGGLYGEELAKVCGVSDAVFSHIAGFVGAAKTKEGAIAMTKIALDNRK